jgi:hypothetical protein
MASRTISTPALEAPLRASGAGGAADGPDEAGPPSEIRPIEGAGRTATLLVTTALAGVEAESAWVTITRAGGIVCFEGPLLDDGTVQMVLEVALGAARVCVRLETSRWHRQAEILVERGPNVYAFG